MSELTDILKAEIETRLGTIATLETEVDALQRTVDILRRNKAAAEEVDLPAPEPFKPATPSPAQIADAPVPDPALVAMFNEEPTRIGALRRITDKHGQVDIQAAAVALQHSNDPNAASDLPGCAKQVRQLMGAYKGWRSAGNGIYVRSEPPALSVEPTPAKPTCPKCGGNLSEQVVMDTLGCRETVSQCRQCGHEVAMENTANVA